MTAVALRTLASCASAATKGAGTLKLMTLPLEARPEMGLAGVRGARRPTTVSGMGTRGAWAAPLLPESPW